MWSQRLQNERDGGVGTLGAETHRHNVKNWGGLFLQIPSPGENQIRMQSRTMPSSTYFSSLPSANLREGT